MIPLDGCIERHIYTLKSRNLPLGVFDGRAGFIGIREKLGTTFLAKEYHWDTGSPFGTATPIEDIGVLPDTIPLTESMPSICSHHGRETRFERIDGRKGVWVHVDDGSVMEKEDFSMFQTNEILYFYLAAREAIISET
jgi:hypothetical protein